MRVAHADEASAKAFLVRRLGYGVDQVELVGAGNWSRAFGFTASDRELVVRVGAARIGGVRPFGQGGPFARMTVLAWSGERIKLARAPM